ncbi:flagellar basal-body MS-ring/collar protein FliF [Sporofaciens musculi]|jgi:flagellar M-ring protein FliF|uniref:flagellar basal-body MS-ring/collar protein FliF n=1 Tax=Sporofaciens musculi TaxID=2681861 RepID=UPI0025A125A8|nr:flagellar basal-body MS-ring/collar protein FliF [Sporofaciens musculi]
MKEKFEQFKEFVGNLSRKVKIMIIVGAVVLIGGAVTIAIILNNRPYTELFSGLGQEEMQQIAQKLTEDGIDYKFNGESTIMVKEDTVDQTKATLVQAGYPKNGFTYDTFKDNASMLTTDSDKKTYKLYELQDRIGSTIRLFDGVKDAKVTIALGEESKYALNDEEEKSSASVVAVMQDGGSPTEDQVVAIQRLVAKSIPGMELEDVAVIDGNGNDVSVDGNGNSSNSSTTEELARMVENSISASVMKVLGPIYGQENVRVTAHARLNMERLIRQQTTYTTPDKINEEDKSGIISHEELYEEQAGTGDGAGGVAGTETNADTPEYNTDGDADGTNAYSESAVRDYLVNELKEEGQIDPGELEDLTVSVAINGNGYGSLRENQIRSLVGNAAGIAADAQEEKIAIVSAPFDGIDADDESEEVSSGGILESIPLWAIIAAAALLLLLIIVIIILVVRRRKQDEEEIEELVEEAETVEEIPAVLDMNEELLQLQNDRSMELKKNVREFAEQNAEISAQLLKNWLNGGVADGGE